jgi:hypothetical protein
LRGHGWRNETFKSQLSDRIRFEIARSRRIGTRACADLSLADPSATSPEMLGAELPRFQRLGDWTRRNYWDAIVTHMGCCCSGWYRQ